METKTEKKKLIAAIVSGVVLVLILVCATWFAKNDLKNSLVDNETTKYEEETTEGDGEDEAVDGNTGGEGNTNNESTGDEEDNADNGSTGGNEGNTNNGGAGDNEGNTNNGSAGDGEGDSEEATTGGKVDSEEETTGSEGDSEEETTGSEGDSEEETTTEKPTIIIEPIEGGNDGKWSEIVK